jgi:hypothetical protein
MKKEIVEITQNYHYHYRYQLPTLSFHAAITGNAIFMAIIRKRDGHLLFVD